MLIIRVPLVDFPLDRHHPQISLGKGPLFKSLITP